MSVQDYATFDIVNIQSIVAAAKMRLGIRDSNENDLFMKDLVIEGYKKVGAQLSYVQKYAVLTIENLRAQLPSDFVALNKYNGCAFVNADGLADFGNMGNSVPFNADSPFAVNSPFEGLADVDFSTFQIQNGYLYFSSNTGADYIAISYLAVNQDENGDIIIPEVYQNALIPYVCFQFCLTNSDPRYSEYKSQYMVNLRAVRGRVNLPDASQNQLIAYKFNTIL